jgi:hypothetical protein
VGKPEFKGPLLNCGHRWEVDIKTELQEVGWGSGMDQIDVAEDRDRWQAHVNAVINLQVP